MITKSLAKALKEIGFTLSEGGTPDKSHAYAIYGGYMLTVYETAGKRTAYINFKFSDNEENALKRYDISESFSAEMDEYSVVDYELSEDGMRVVCNGSIAVFLKLIDRCIDIIKENEIRGVEYCSKCGNKFGSRKPKKVTQGKENHIMCEHCALETVEELSNASALKEAGAGTGSVKFGVLGSLAFGFIGTLLYFVLYYWISPKIGDAGSVRYIFCAMGALVALLSYIGYRLFCKKISPAAYVSISVSSLLFTAIGQYIGIVFEFFAQNNIALSSLSNKHFWLIHLRNTVPAEVAELFPDYAGDFYKFLAISLMFAAVGAAIFLLTLHDKAIIKKETAIIETISIG